MDDVPGGHPATADAVDGRAPLRMYGGPWTAAVPALVFIGLLAWLSVEERADISGFWVGGWLALAVGLLLVRTKREYAESVIRGLSDRTGVVIVAAFIFAGVFGALMAAGGLVDGLLWFGLETGIQGAAFTVLVFVLSSIFALGTGTSVGTVVALVPVLYPAGVMAGSDPLMVAVAVLAGGAFGDNLAPISDTTITSAFTQDADMGDVVRSRLPLAASAAVVAVVVFAVFGGGGEVVDAGAVDASVDPVGLVMLIPFVVVIASALSRRPIVESLIWGSITAIVVGALSGGFGLSEVFSVPAERGDSTGVIQDGISGVTGAVIFVLFILALTQVFVDSGIMRLVLARLRTRAVNGVRSAEVTIVGVSLLFSIPLGANAPAILLVGPSLVRPLGEQFNLARARRSNLMDCAVCTIYYMLPWHNAVIVWYATLLAASAQFDLTPPPISAAFANPYSWALLVVILVSAVTGWNRKYADKDDEARVA